MARETWVQSQVESYRRLTKWYLITPFKTLGNIRYVSRDTYQVEQSREKSSALPLHLGVVAIEKGAFGSPSTTVANFTLTYVCKYMIYIYIYIYHASEISRPIHIPRQQYLIYWRWCQHTNLERLPLIGSHFWSSLLRCGTRPNEWDIQWDSNSLVYVC